MEKSQTKSTQAMKIEYLEAQTTMKYIKINETNSEQISQEIFTILFNRSYINYLEPHIKVSVQMANDIAYNLFVKYVGFSDEFIMPVELQGQFQALLALYRRAFLNTKELMEFYENPTNSLNTTTNKRGPIIMWDRNWKKTLGEFTF